MGSRHGHEEETKKEEAAASDVSLKELSKKLDDFAKERDWEMYHAPRNLLLAMIAEVGELSELFMWKGEVAKGLPGWKESEKEHLGEELSDVLLFHNPAAASKFPHASRTLVGSIPPPPPTSPNPIRPSQGGSISFAAI